MKKKNLQCTFDVTKLILLLYIKNCKFFLTANLLRIIFALLLQSIARIYSFIVYYIVMYVILVHNM